MPLYWIQLNMCFMRGVVMEKYLLLHLTRKESLLLIIMGCISLVHFLITGYLFLLVFQILNMVTFWCPLFNFVFPIWHLHTNFLILNSKAVTCLAYSKGGNLLISGSEDGIVRVWNAKTRNIVRMFKHAKGVE